MDLLPFADRLELLGVLAGAFLVLAGLGTVAGQPWTTAGSGAVAGIRVLGAVLAIAVGVGLVWTTRSDSQPA